VFGVGRGGGICKKFIGWVVSTDCGDGLRENGEFVEQEGGFRAKKYRNFSIFSLQNSEGPW